MPAVFEQHRDHMSVAVDDVAGEGLLEVPGHDIRSVVRQWVPHHHRAVDGAGEQRQSAVPGAASQLPRVTPAGEQVEVDLIGLRAGDGVVVRAVGQLHPGLGQRRLGIGGAGQQRGEHREPLGLQHRVLRRPLACLVSM